MLRNQIICNVVLEQVAHNQDRPAFIGHQHGFPKSF
jgi:hypothetical protein